MSKSEAGRSAETSIDEASVQAWFGQRLPQDWAAGPVAVTVDREEITVVIPLLAPELEDSQSNDAAEAVRAEAIAGLVARWREDTRRQRMAIAREAEHRFDRKVAWGVQVGAEDERPPVIFTHLAVPVMTRLRQPERVVLDTLVAAGVARSRSHALAWCVSSVGQNAEAWLGDLRSAMAAVERVRHEGPKGG